ncbi:hypothetical protein BC832DRAFT_546770 [Gaertneriomyces semiglobifer]|nr:hypothetical protein BC832DRAFT_546770 [Gaertneriomyces semiglobifer]
MPATNLPAEVLFGIICMVGVESPADVLNCLLTCKAWSKLAISWREKCLFRYHFKVIQDFPKVLILKGYEDGECTSVNNNLYKIWFRTYVAHLVSEFSWLTTMQKELSEHGQILTRRPDGHVPDGDSDWKCLYHELALLKQSFGFIRTYSHYDEDVDDGHWETQPEGAMGCPLLLSPVPELENPLIANRELIGTVLTRLGVEKPLQPHYFVDRVRFDDQEKCSQLLQELRIYLYFFDPDQSEEPDDYSETMLSG